MATGRGIPPAASALVGRAPDVAAVRSLLASPARLVTITGPPGVGKTRLAQAVITDPATDSADVVAWVDLAPVRTSDRIVGEICRSLGVAERSAAPDAATLTRALGTDDVLLVLDNCEHLLDGAGVVGELLAATRSVRILATSRERLHLTAEREYPLPPLPMPGVADIADPDRLRANASVAMLLAYAPPAVQVTPRTSQALGDICIRLDGLPLALELAAARLRVFTPSELAFRLEHHTANLTSPTRDSPRRHRDIDSAIAWSYELLPESERAVFERLSVFTGTWTLDDATAICPAMRAGDVEIAVESLLDKSLIRRIEATDGTQPARFRMLFSVREFASTRLTEAGRADDAHIAHMRHFAQVAVGWEATVGTNEENLVWQWTDYARTNLVAAFAHARERDDDEAVLQLAATLGWYWHTRGLLADVPEIRTAVARIVANGTPAGTGGDHDPLAAALVAMGVVAVGIGDLDAAERDLQHGLELSGDVGDERRVAMAEAFLGHAARMRGRYDLARSRYAAAAAIYRRTGNERGMAWAAHDRALLAYETGDPATAEEEFREALDRFRGLEYEWAVAVCEWGLGSALIAADRTGEAPQLLRDALLAHDAVGDHRGVAQCLESLATLAHARAADATAARLLGAADAVRSAAAALPSPAEQHRLDALAARLTRSLGRSAADHERRAGAALPPVTALALAAGYAAQGAGALADAADDPPLTARQRDVAALVAAGRTNRQIGRALGISERTAEVHVRNIMDRLRTGSRAGVAAWAASRGLMAPSDS